MGKLKKALAGLMAVCMLMSTLTRLTPWLPLVGKALRPPPSTLPLFCLFSLQSSILRFKELKIIHNFSFLIRPCRMFV